MEKKLKQAKAIRSREGYFTIGDTFEVEMISPSLYRAHGKDWLGYEWNCLVSPSKFVLIGE